MIHSEKPPKQYAPLVLAYIGDCVYEIFIRTKMIEKHPDMPVHKLHVHTIKYVKASAQSKSVSAIEGMLTEDEEWIFKRGRNAKSATVPKNADISDYRRATGFEALIGYLYLSGMTERLNEIMEKAFENAF